MLRRLGQSLQIALPKQIVGQLHLRKNDYVDVRMEGGRIVLEPFVVFPRDQAYFFTREWQKEEVEAGEDIREGRITRTKNMKHLIRRLKSKRAS